MIQVVKLFDPNFAEKCIDFDYDYRKPMPEPEVTHMLATTRSFSENEKSDMYAGLEILRQSKQLDKYQQSETYKQKAIDLGIYMFEFEYSKGSVKAKWTT
jgi:hypothetical protein